MMIYKKSFKNKKVIITGHTGFKGSWLTLWLSSLGAKVYGISLNIPTKPSNFETLKLHKKCTSSNLNINNFSKIIFFLVIFKP